MALDQETYKIQISIRESIKCSEEKEDKASNSCWNWKGKYLFFIVLIGNELKGCKINENFYN